MRAGRLRNRAAILSLGADLQPVDHGSRWVSIRAKDTGDVGQPSGLRSTALVEVRARYTSELQQGRYLRHGNRLLYIASAPRDPMGNRVEMVMSCAELTGQAATYHATGRQSQPCRVHISYSAPYLDELGQVVDYRTRAEVALIEVGRVQVGDQLRLGDEHYAVIGIAAEGDDGVVRGLWLERN